MLKNFYPMWMDIHVMIFVGFGFLMVFLKTHCWSSIGFNYLCAAWCLQCGILFQGFWRMALIEGFEHKINVNMLTLCEAEFCAGAFLISMGALLGKATFPQLMLLATIESLFMTLNAVIVFEVLHVVDIGGALTIHMFGAYFGLAATYFFQPARALKDEKGQNGGSYNSQLIAMIGTIFLFMYWPSFNAILGYGLAQQRAIVNTLLSITASTLTSVYVSRAILGKIDMEVLLNSTLAGGVVMGASCDLFVQPGGAMVAGAVAGGISALGYLKLNDFCKTKLKLHDTCGVHFLHGIPGTLGGISAVICCAMAEYNFENNPTQLSQMFSHYPERSMQTQTWYQIAGMFVTWGIAIPTGALFGFIVSRMPMPAKQFDDTGSFQHCTYGDDTAQYNVAHEHMPTETAVHPEKNVQLAEGL